MPTGRSSAFPSSRAPDGGRQKEKRGQVYFPPSSGARLERAGVRVDLPQAPAALGRAQWLASRPSPCRLPRFLRRRRIGIHFALAPSLGRIRMSYRLAGLAAALLLAFSTHAPTPAPAPAPAPPVLKAAHPLPGRRGPAGSPGRGG